MGSYRRSSYIIAKWTAAVIAITRDHGDRRDRDHGDRDHSQV